MKFDKNKINKPKKDKYELTLAEFPIFCLSKKNSGAAEYIQYEDTITGKNGAIVKRKWTVYPDSKHGFGTPSTFTTFYDLFQIWKEDNFNSQHIRFGSLYNLLQARQFEKESKLKKKSGKFGKRNYTQIENDLNCLIGIKIQAKNAFWDNELKAYVDKTFHLFDDLSLYKTKAEGQATLPFSNIKASDVLFGSIQKNSLLSYNYSSDFFHTLTPTEQRLSLYLAKIFRSQAIHKRNILELAKQIPINDKLTKHVKEKFKKAGNGLIKKGFDILKNFYFEKRAKTEPELIIFERAGKPPQKFNNNILTDKEPYQIEALVEDILAVCQDQQSTGFYKKVAMLLPDNIIYRTISEVKEIRDLGEIKKSTGALFTSLIKKYAEERNIDL